MESLVSPVEVMGRWGGGGTWQIVQGHGKPAQCWNEPPSCSGGAGPLFIKECGALMEVSPGNVLESVAEAEEVSALPRRGCTWCAATLAPPWLTVPQ